MTITIQDPELLLSVQLTIRDCGHGELCLTRGPDSFSMTLQEAEIIKQALTHLVRA